MYKSLFLPTRWKIDIFLRFLLKNCPGENFLTLFNILVVNILPTIFVHFRKNCRKTKFFTAFSPSLRDFFAIFVDFLSKNYLEKKFLLSFPLKRTVSKFISPFFPIKLVRENLLSFFNEIFVHFLLKNFYPSSRSQNCTQTAFRVFFFRKMAKK